MKRIMFRLFLIFALGLITYSSGFAQIKGEPVKPFNPDTVFIFESPRPLIKVNDADVSDFAEMWGFNLLFSDNGVGAGFFIQWALDKNTQIFTNLYISGARNTDEIDYLYPDGSYRVPGKINRLFMFPLSLGIRRILFEDQLSDNLKPFISAGLGPTFILSTPYEREFFNSFGYGSFFTRFNFFVDLGAFFGFSTKSRSGVNIRYYYIPFGGDGLESIEGKPIHNFGGIFLSLIFGIPF